MKDKTLLALATMLISIGLSSSVYARTCKTGNPYVHTKGGCNDPGGTGSFCFGCNGDSDAGGCGTPLGAANVCVHTARPHIHVSTYAWTPSPKGFPYMTCIPFVFGMVNGGNGANTGAPCITKPEDSSTAP